MAATPEQMSARLQEIVRRRDRVLSNKQKLEGMEEAAKRALEEQYEKCRKQGVEPEELPEKIAGLTQALNQTLDMLDKQVGEAETKLAPYLEGD